MLGSINDLDSNEINRISDFYDHKTSYVLNSYDLIDPDIKENLIMVILSILFFVVLCYFTLIYKIRK